MAPFPITLLQIYFKRLYNLLLHRLKNVASTHLSLLRLFCFQRFIFLESKFRHVVGAAFNSRSLATNRNGVHEHRIGSLHLRVMRGTDSTASSSWFKNLVIHKFPRRFPCVERIYNPIIFHHVIVNALLERILESKLSTWSLRRIERRHLII